MVRAYLPSTKLVTLRHVGQLVHRLVEDLLLLRGRSCPCWPGREMTFWALALDEGLGAGVAGAA
jgi:hypothetical protein